MGVLFHYNNYQRITPMKTSFFLLAAFMILSGSSPTIHTKVNLTSREVLTKCINLYDPANHWENYSGKVHLNTIFPESTHEEILEINNRTGFYQSTMLHPDGNIVRGMNGRECFSKIGDQTDLSERQIEENGLDCHSISLAREHHICHFGFILNAEKAGLALENNVESATFNGWDCYVLTFTGNPEEVTHDYYVGIRKAYIDKEEFLLRGLYFKHPDFPPRSCIYTGKMEINHILIPQVVSVYNTDNNSLFFVDVFNPVN